MGEYNNKLERAKKRVSKIKGFYVHLTVYVFVNTIILANGYLSLGDGESFWEWGRFFTLIFWGIGVLGHAAGAFQYNPLFTKDWEKKQIQKYLDKDGKETEKYR